MNTCTPTHPCRLLSALPTEMLSPLVVPAGAADALAALARDALACSLLPAGTQEAALAVLRQLRPDVQQVNDGWMGALHHLRGKGCSPQVPAQVH